MKQLFLLFSIVVLLGTTAAQAVKFTSSYTDVLGDSCISQDNENQNGDGSAICKGIDEYELFVYFNVYGHEIIQLQSTDTAINYAGSLSSENCSDTHQYGTKIEWRYANGKPFAAIVRITCVVLVELKDEDTDLLFEAFEEEDQYLIIVGLKGYESINGEIAVKGSSNANKEARELAEFGYLKIVSKD